jgi:hypothetical protein
LVRFLQQRIPETKLPVYAALFVTFGVVLAHALFRHDYYPSECCQITNRDDLALLTWIDTSLPPEAFILIAASPVNVTSLEQAEIQAGVDGGIWVTPLTSRQSCACMGELLISPAQPSMRRFASAGWDMFMRVKCRRVFPLHNLMIIPPGINLLLPCPAQSCIR